MSDSNRKSSGAWCAPIARFMGGAALLMAAASASAQSVVIQARGTLAANVGPVMQLRVNNTLVGSVEVRSAVFTDYSFDTGAVPAGAKVEVVFTNDTCCSNGDRNLYVQAIRLNGAVVTPTDPGVLFEIGVGNAALDGTGTRPGLSAMLWSGALRFYAPATTSSGPTYYFSDCQLGAVAACVPGSNANPGTSASAPKRDLVGIDVNALPAGTRLLFARGGVWTGFNQQLHNLNVTAAAPLVFDAYTAAWGSSNRPWIKAGGAFYAFQTSFYGRTEDTGGYVIRNLKLDGLHTAGAWGVHLRNRSHDVLLENLEITGFELAMHSSNESPIGRVTLRNSLIHHNSEMGILGEADHLTIEGNRFEANNFSGSNRNHAIYLSGGGREGVLRNNTFVNNSAVSGLCTGGNVTVHGQWDGMLIEGNTITQAASTGGCYGISVTPGYDLPEYFRNFVIRGNTVVNVGGCAICLGAAVGPVVENNLLINLNNTWMSGVVLAANVSSPGAGGDAVDNGAIVRNNTMCFVYPRPESEQVVTRNAGQVTVTGTVYRTGADATTGPCAR